MSSNCQNFLPDLFRCSGQHLLHIFTFLCFYSVIFASQPDTCVTSARNTRICPRNRGAGFGLATDRLTMSGKRLRKGAFKPKLNLGLLPVYSWSQKNEMGLRLAEHWKIAMCNSGRIAVLLQNEGRWTLCLHCWCLMLSCSQTSQEVELIPWRFFFITISLSLFLSFKTGCICFICDNCSRFFLFYPISYTGPKLNCLYTCSCASIMKMTTNNQILQ